MKKIRNFVLILALFMCFNGCEKNPISDEPVQNRSQFTIEQAEAWFGSEWTGAVRIKSGNVEKARIGIKPDWCNGFTSQNDEVEVVEVGLMVQGWFGMSDETSYQDWVKTKNSKMIRSLTRMVFLKYKKEDRIDQFLMTVVGDKEYHDKKVGRLSDNSYLAKEKHFSGRIYYHDLTGRFVNGWVYEKGELVGIAKQISGEGLPTELKIATTCITTNIYSHYIQCTDWYRDSNGNGTYDEGSDEFMYFTCGDTYTLMASFIECPVYSTSLNGFKTDYVVKLGGTNGGYDPSQSTVPVPCNCLNKCTVCGKCKDALILKSAGTSCVPWAVCSCPPEPSIIVSNLERLYPCGYEVYTSFGNFNNFISSTLQNTFGSSHTFNVTFNGAALGGGTDGDFSGQATGLNPDGTLAGGNFTIRVDDYVLNNSTKEYIAVTYAHETLHALINYYNATDPNKGKELFPIFYEWPSYEDGEHLTIANLYVSQMADVVRQINPNMPISDAKCLAWNGLQGTRTYDIQRLNYDQINGSGAWDRKMAEVNSRERNGTSTIGIKCPH